MNKKTLILFIILIIFSSTCFFFIGRFTAHTTDAGVIVPSEEYSKLMDLDDSDKKIEEILSLIEDNYLYEFSEKDLESGKIKGIVNALGDPYSEYFTKEEFASFMEDSSGEFGGIGIVVSPNENGYITVIAPIVDTPAYRAGIKAGDYIVVVDGIDYTASDMNEAVKHMRGEPNTKVNLKILRDGEFIDFELIREIIQVESVKTSMLDDNVGYLQITSFDANTYEQFRIKLNGLKEQGAKGIVLDLRGNPGGLLDVVEDIADYLLGEVNIIYVQNKYGDKEYSNSDKKMEDIPITILIDKGSASASEILAGSLKDNGRAKIVGETSFGKGIVQRLHEFEDGSGLKLTESEYYLPNGETIHKKGIEPDYVVEFSEAIKGIGPEYKEEDIQLQKAIEVLKEEIK